jgi:hypothetical protein
MAGFLARGVGVAFGAVSRVVVPAAGALVPVLEAAGAAGRALFDLVKFEIFRDFMQIISLFFAGLAQRLPKSFRDFWGNVADLFSICWSCWMDSHGFAVALFFIKALIVLVLGNIFLYRARRSEAHDQTQGLEAVKWSQRSAAEHRFVRINALVLTSLYLPVARDVLQIWTCDIVFVPRDESCNNGLHNFMIFVSIVLAINYLLLVPYMFYVVIQRNKPKERFYDEEGELRKGAVAYTDADYRADLIKDKSPYKSLYESYERKWAFYKVIGMVMKVVLVLPATLLVASNSIGGRITPEDPEFDSGDRGLLLAQSILTFIVLGIYAGLAWSSRPFLRNSDDALDGLSRFTCLVTAFFGILTFASGNNTAFGVILNILVTISSAAMLFLVVNSFPSVRRRLKAFRGEVELSPAHGDPSTPLLFSNELNLEREEKLRVWHEFWDVLFSQDPDLRLPHDEKARAEPGKYVPVPVEFHYGENPPYLLNFRGTVMERHLENKEIASFESVESYETALAYACAMHEEPRYDRLKNVVQTVVRSLVGMDVYWPGMVEAKPEGKAGQQKERRLKAASSPTGFGKLYCIPFPFVCVLTFDDSEEYAVFAMAPIVSGVRRDMDKSVGELCELVELNFRAEVLEKKKIRLSLRCLSGEMVEFFHQEWRNFTKRREAGRDANGNVRYETYTVRCLLTFRRGVFSVAQDPRRTVWTDPESKQELNVGRGFNCTITYHDGEGQDEEGEWHRNQSTTIGHDKLGINNTFTMTPDLQRLLGPHQAIIERHWAPMLQLHERYRNFYFSEFARKEATLSYGFWYYVYNHSRVSPDLMVAALRQAEHHAAVRAIPDKYRDEIAMVYAKLAFFRCHPGVSVWFCFWHDVWYLNGDVPRVTEAAAVLDPTKPDAICYQLKTRPELERFLDEHKLRDRGGTPGCMGLFVGGVNQELLDRLYQTMEAVTRNPPPPRPPRALLAEDRYLRSYVLGANIYSGQDVGQVLQGLTRQSSYLPQEVKFDPAEVAAAERIQRSWRRHATKRGEVLEAKDDGAAAQQRQEPAAAQPPPPEYSEQAVLGRSASIEKVAGAPAAAAEAPVPLPNQVAAAAEEPTYGGQVGPAPVPVRSASRDNYAKLADDQRKYEYRDGPEPPRVEDDNDPYLREQKPPV